MDRDRSTGETSSSDASRRKDRKVSSSAAATWHVAPVQNRLAQQPSDMSPSELQRLVDRNLSSSGGGVWSTRRAMMQFNREAIHEAMPRPDDDWDKLADRVGQLAAVNSFDEALKIVESLSKQNTTDALARICHKEFMKGAALHMQPAAAVSFLHLLPKRYHNLKLYNLALQACAYGRDLTRALEILELLDALRVKKDAKLLTSMINVCASVGNAERAFKFFSDVKQEFPQQVDGKVYGSVVAACAEAMLREVSVVHERKDQYVLLERAFQVVLDAEKCSVPLEIPVYNSLLVCAGRSGQIGRAFEVLDMMLARGLRPDAITHGSLIEACVQAKRKDLALKIFHGALQRGFGDKVEIYTAAISACKIEGSVDLAKALEIHTLLDRAAVQPDKKFYAALAAVAGKAGRMDVAFEAVQDYVTEGLPLSTTLANALLYAAQGDVGVMRRIYDYCVAQGVYPEISQYNRMLDEYASQSRFGEVVTLVCDLVKSGRAPNLNTYRIILNACQRSEQGQVVLEIFSLLREKRIPILQHKFAQSIYYTVLKACYGQMRALWWQNPQGTRAPYHSASSPVLRLNESEKLIQALKSSGRTGASISGRAAPSSRVSSFSNPSLSSSSSSSSLSSTSYTYLSTPAEAIDWQRQAIMAYRDLVSTGYKPSLDVLDMILNCLRLKQDPSSSSSSTDPSHPSFPQQPSSPSPSFTSPNLPLSLLGGQGSFSPALTPRMMGGTMGGLGVNSPGSHISPFGPLVTHGTTPTTNPVSSSPGAPSSSSSGGGGGVKDEKRAKGDPSSISWFDPVFDQRALSILEDAVNKGHLPINIKGIEDGPAILDLCSVPPTLAEVIVMAVLASFEKKAVKTGRCQVFHNVTFVVPPFNPDYVLWPSYVEKIHLHYKGPLLKAEGEAGAGASTESMAKDVAASSVGRKDGGGSSNSNSGSDEFDLFRSPSSSLEDQDEGDEDGEGGLPPDVDFNFARASFDDNELPLTAAEAASAMAALQSAPSPDEAASTYQATSTTGLAVAATCRRMKVFSKMDPSRGKIVLGSKELSRWLITRRSYELMAEEGGGGGMPMMMMGSRRGGAEGGKAGPPSRGQQQEGQDQRRDGGEGRDSNSPSLAHQRNPARRAPMRHKLGLPDQAELTFRAAPAMIDTPTETPSPSPPPPSHHNMGGESPEGSVSEDESDSRSNLNTHKSSSSAKRPMHHSQGWPLIDRPNVRRSSSGKAMASPMQLESEVLVQGQDIHVGGGEGQQPMRVTFTHATGDAIEGWGKSQVEGR